MSATGKRILVRLNSQSASDYFTEEIALVIFSKDRQTLNVNYFHEYNLRKSLPQFSYMFYSADFPQIATVTIQYQESNNCIVRFAHNGTVQATSFANVVGIILSSRTYGGELPSGCSYTLTIKRYQSMFISHKQSSIVTKE
jgi:hypothetical protein